MKKSKKLTILLLCLLGIGFYRSFTDSTNHSPKSDFSNERKMVLPQAVTFVKKLTPFPHYLGYSLTHQLTGYTFLTTDLAPEVSGYSGPIKLLVGVSTKDNTIKVHLISHSETSNYFSNQKMFLAQFNNQKSTTEFELGKNIDGITHATISSAAIVNAMNKSLNVFNKEYNPLFFQPKHPRAPTRLFDPVLLFIFSLAAFNFFIKSRFVRFLALCFSFIYLGILTANMFSILQIINVALLKIPPFNSNPYFYTLLGLLLLSLITLGNIYCASICPFAALQECISFLSKKCRIKKLLISKETDQAAKNIKYAILFVLIILCLYFGTSEIANIEVFVFLFTQKTHILGWSLVGFMLLMAIFHPRFWCKYFCPAGAFNILISRLSLKKLFQKKTK